MQFVRNGKVKFHQDILAMDERYQGRWDLEGGLLEITYEIRTLNKNCYVQMNLPQLYFYADFKK